MPIHCAFGRDIILMDILLKFSTVCNIGFAIGRYRYHRQSTCPTRLDRSEIFFFDDLRGYGTMDVMSRDLVIKVIDMDFFGQPIWVVGLVCLGVFCASFMDAIGGGGGIISLPTYLLAGLPMHYALGTNKLSSCIGTVASTVRYIKNGYVDWLLGIPSIALALVGAHLGTRLHLAMDEQYLKLVLLFVLPVIAVILLKKKELPEEKGGAERVAAPGARLERRPCFWYL